MSALADDAPRGFVPMAEYLRLQRRCDELEERLAATNEEIREGASHDRLMAARFKLGLTEQETKLVLFCFDQRFPRPRSLAAEAMGAFGSYAEDQVNIVAHKLNRKLRKQGAPDYVVRGVRGQGGNYGLSPEGREWLRPRLSELETERGQA